MVPAEARAVADIGAGDGQLARDLTARGVRVVASERSPGPFRRLSAGNPGLDCRMGEGLEVLGPSEVEGAILAGMGGWKIARILSASPDAVRKLDWLVLQPQQNPSQLADWLAGAGFRTLAVETAAERGRCYTVLLVSPPDDGS
jgi:tRNA (adenine22-N1)-methyltransferase